LESFYFCELGALAKFQNPTTTPFERKVKAEEERKKKAKFALRAKITASQESSWRDKRQLDS
jgi:hypothetical protein